MPEEAAWEDDEWEANIPVLKPAAELAAATSSAGVHGTKGQAVLAAASEPDASKFADEDQDEPEVQHDVVKPQPKKKEEKKWLKGEQQEAALDDPVAEKLRQQRLVEQQDLAAARELFGDAATSNPLDTFLPKSVKDFDDFAGMLASRYILPHKDSKNFKALIKSLVRQACQPMTSGDCKEVEDCVGVVRVEKAKAEQAAKQKAAPKKSLNMGKGLSAGLDDFVYEDAGDGDDDFM